MACEVENCLECQKVKVCNLCSSNYLVSIPAGSEQSSCVECGISIPECTSCAVVNQEATCTACKAGFDLKSDKKSCQRTEEKKAILSTGAVIVLIVMLAVLVVVLIGWFAWRYRKRGEKKPKNPRQYKPLIDNPSDTKALVTAIQYIDELSRKYAYEAHDTTTPSELDFQFDPDPTQDLLPGGSVSHEPGTVIQESSPRKDQAISEKTEGQARIKNTTVQEADGDLRSDEATQLLRTKQRETSIEHSENTHAKSTVNQVSQRPTMVKIDSKGDPHSMDEENPGTSADKLLADTKTLEDKHQAQKPAVGLSKRASPLFSNSPGSQQHQ
jgi:hypothetical protein